MIQSKQDLQYYLEQDKLALHYALTDKPNIIKDEIWKWEILLRKNEYVTNCLTKFVWLPYKAWIKYRFYKESVRLGFSIPLNCFGPGLSIAPAGARPAAFRGCGSAGPDPWRARRYTAARRGGG